MHLSLRRLYGTALSDLWLGRPNPEITFLSRAVKIERKIKAGPKAVRGIHDGSVKIE
jgi:hypothetical protein